MYGQQVLNLFRNCLSTLPRFLMYLSLETCFSMNKDVCYGQSCLLKRVTPQCTHLRIHWLIKGMNLIKHNILSKISPIRSVRREARKKLRYFKPNFSYSQEGEDMVLRRFFEQQENGFYVDVGAHHPYRFSNTALLYEKGWRGINLDPNPGTSTLFNRYRPRDVNLELGVSSNSEPLDFYIFNEPALNTFDSEVAAEHIVGGKWKLLDKKVVQQKALSEILDEYLPEGQEIDFFTIDVEGLGYDVLASNDWNKYSPKLVLIEILGDPALSSLLSMPEAELLKSNGYELVAKTVNTAFFQKDLDE